MSAYEFHVQLDLFHPERVHPGGGADAVQELGRRIQRQWPAITLDWEEQHRYSSLPDHLFLRYAANTGIIQLSVSPIVEDDSERIHVDMELTCQNPPEVKRPFLDIVKWLMEEFGMECRPGWALSEPPAEDDLLPLDFRTFEDALPVIERRLNRTWEFWQTYFPERCGSKPRLKPESDAV